MTWHCVPGRGVLQKITRLSLGCFYSNHRLFLDKKCVKMRQLGVMWEVTVDYKTTEHLAACRLAVTSWLGEVTMAGF